MRRAFTLIELLLVIAILGVLAAVVIPQFNVGLASARVRVAAQAYVQSSRYARTMALLHQIETEVIVETGGVIRVEAGPPAAESRGPYAAPETLTNAPAAREAASALPADAFAGIAPPPAAEVSARELAAEGDVAEQVRVRQAFEGVHVEFLGYTDEAPPFAASEASPESFRIRYRSNGVGRPHRVRFTDGENVTIDVSLDMLGAGVVEGEERE
jgi:prepilin-type N-terminal cleavage/methylation domain-containing protein